MRCSTFFTLPLLAMMSTATALGWADESIQRDRRFDRWMYPFNASPGGRTTGSTFGAVENPSFDDFDAQLIVGFHMGDAIPSGLSLDMYQVSRLTVTLTTSTADAFLLDPTYDENLSYLNPEQDLDAGRPIELYGVGLRNGYQALDTADDVAGPPLFGEAESFGTPGPPAPARRHAFASDFAEGVARDVSNHVRESFETQPWAVGNVSGIDPGSPVPVNSAVTFDLNVGDNDVQTYLRQGLQTGQLFFSIVSLHDSEIGSSAGIPSFHLADSAGNSLGQVAQLSLDYRIVPEPAAGLLLLSGVGIVPRRRRASVQDHHRTRGTGR